MQEEHKTTPAETEPAKKKKERSGSGRVTVYLAILFAVAFLLLMMSYLSSQRTNRIAMGNLADSHAQATASAFENMEAIQTENEALRDLAEQDAELIAQLEDQVDSLTGQVEALQNSAQANQQAVELLLLLQEAVSSEDYQTAESYVNQAVSQGSAFTEALSQSQLSRWNLLCSQIPAED